MQLETVLFDVDGTLVDSNDAHARAWVDALDEAGFDVPFDRVRPLIGMGSDKLLPELGAGLTADRDPGKTITERRKAIFLERYVGTLAPTPGAHELVAALKTEGLRCVVATSAQEDELDPLLRVANAEDLFDHAATSADAKRSKPDPDIVGAALERSKSSAERSVMVGDTRYDVEAAATAGVPCIALRCGGTSDADLGGAVAVYDDPQHMLDAIRAKPLAEITRRARSSP